MDQWVCQNIVQLLRDENTIPFVVRYRKELINHMDADAVRDVQLNMEELWLVRVRKVKPCSSVIILSLYLSTFLTLCKNGSGLLHL